MSADLHRLDDALRSARRRQVAQLRVPPHSIEAEQSVLGGLLLDNGAWDRVGDLLGESDFYRYEHRLIYARDRRADQRHQAGRRHHRLRAAAEPRQGRGGRRAGLPELARAVACRARPTSAATRRSCASARSCASWSPPATRSPPTPSIRRARPSTQILDEAERKIFNIGEEGSRDEAGLPEHGPLVVQLIDRVNEMADNGAEDITGVPHRLLRPRPHDRRPAGGRPDRAGGAAVDGQDRARAQHRRARRASTRACRSPCSRWKWARAQLAMRMVGSIGRIDQQHLRTGAPRATTNGAASDGGDREARARSASSSTRAAALTPSELRARARRLARQCGKLGPDRGRLPAADERRDGTSDENRATEIGEISRGLKVAGQGAEVPGDRAVAAEPRRRVAHRQAADDDRPARIGRHRAGRRRRSCSSTATSTTTRTRKEPGVAEIIIGKQRNGPTGTVQARRS